MAYHSKAQAPAALVVEGTEAPRLKHHAALQLLQAWRTAEVQEQYETWPVITTAVEADRLSARALWP